MKRIYLLIAFLSLFFVHETNAYVPLSYKGHFYVYEWNAGLGQFYKTYLTIQCDTNINSKLYYQVFNCDTNGNNTTYRGAIREDTLSQKVYYIASDSLQERLVFDFSLQPNDTFFYSSPSWVKNCRVDSVVTKFLYGQQRKVIYFDSLTPIIEGVGSQLWGLLDRPFDTGGPMATTKIINTYSVQEQCFPTTVFDTDKIDEHISIYPNPVNNEVHVELPNFTLTKPFYTLLNMHGQFIQKGLLNHSQTISFEKFNKGLYILKISIDNRNYFYQVFKE